MYRTLRKPMMLLLCLLLFVCLLPAAFADGSTVDELQAAINNHEASFTLTGDMTIPNGANVESWQTEIIVPANKTLRIEGKLDCHKLTVNGRAELKQNGFMSAWELGLAGSLDLSGNAELHTSYGSFRSLVGSDKISINTTRDNGCIFMLQDAESNSDFDTYWTVFKALPDNYVGRINICYPMEMKNDQSLSAIDRTTGTLDAFNNKPVQIAVRGDRQASLTIAQDVTLNAGFLDADGAQITVHGKLISNTEVKLQPSENCPVGKLIFDGDACYENNLDGNSNGYIQVQGTDEPAAQIVGLTMSRFTVTDNGENTRFVDTSAVFGKLKTAIENKDGFFRLPNGVVTISESIEIPEGMRVGGNAELVIPDGVTLTISGIVPGTSSILVENGGKIVVTEKGWLNVMNWFTLDGSLELENTWIDISFDQWEHWNNSGTLANVTFQGDAGINALCVVQSQDALEAAFNRVVDCVGESNVHPSVVANYAWVVSENMTIPAGVYASVSYNLGSLTVNNGATLTVDGVFNIAGSPANVATIDGALVNNNSINISRRMNGTAPKLIVNGSYSGPGALSVQDTDNPDGYISGVNLATFTRQTVGSGTNYYLAPLESLRAALESGAESYTLSDSVTIPSGVSLNGSTKIIVPADVTLTIRGELHIPELEIQQDGFAAVDAGQLAVMGYLTVDGNLTLNSAWVDVGAISLDNIDTALKADPARISFVGDSGFILKRACMDEENAIHPQYGAITGTKRILDRLGMEHTRAVALINCDVTIPADYDLDAGQGEIVVQDSSNLTILGKLTAASLEIEQRASVTVDGGKLNIYGPVAFGGSMTVKNTSIGVGAISARSIVSACAENKLTLDNGKVNLFRNVQDAENALDAIQEAGYFLGAVGTEHFSYNVEPEFNWTIREDEFVYALNGCSINLHPGRTLTVNGTLLVDFFQDDGTVVVGENGFFYVKSWLNIGENVTQGMFTLNGTLSVEHTALTPEQLEVMENNGLLDVSFNMYDEESLLGEWDAYAAEFPHFQRTFWVLFPWTMDQSRTLPRQVRMYVANDGDGENGSLTIPEGMVLSIPESSKVLARGTVDDDGSAVIKVNGVLVNDGEIELRDDPSRTPADLTLGTNGSYLGTGTITRGGEPYELSVTPLNSLLAACRQTYTEETDLDINGKNTFTLPAAELTVPTNLSILALDSTFVVPEGATFTIARDGELIAGGLDSVGATTVYGLLDVEATLAVGTSPIQVAGEIDLTLDSWLSLWENINANGPDDAAAKFSFTSDDALLDILAPLEEGKVADGLDFPMFDIPHIRETRLLTFPWTLDHSRVLQKNLRLLIHYGGGYTGMLTIPEGMTLTVQEGSELFARGSAGENQPGIVRVEGNLVNEGKVMLHYTRAGLGEISLINKGIYAGSGDLFLTDDAYKIFNNPASADLRLPAALTAVESEALDAGDFVSVYIPENVTSIADDAFGSPRRELLIILGKENTYAQTFAERMGYPFAPVA